MDIIIWTLVIFLARVFDVGLGTIRVFFIVRRKKLLAALTGFVEVLLYILIVSRVIQDIQQWPLLLAYAGGFSVGTLVGMELTERLSRQLVHTTVISQRPDQSVEMALREAGFALTQSEGTGRDGPVSVFEVVCSARGVRKLKQVVAQEDPGAFLYTQDLVSLQGGHVYGLKRKV